MQFKKPKFWKYIKPNFLSKILKPFTSIIILNNFFLDLKKKKKFSQIKSICVGNIYLGGTGKTPLTIKLFNIFNDNNIKTVTAKKNYKNQIDEQIILKKKTKLIVANNRLNAIKNAIDNSYEVIIFDDGLQDSQIDYDLKFICFKVKSWIGNGQLIPAGPLREKLQSLKKYDAVFLNGEINNSKDIEKIIYSINSKIKIFYTYYEPKNLKEIDLERNYLIFSGIGEPGDFKEILLKNKFKISKEIIYPDHYKYSKNDIEEIIKQAKLINAGIITTEKDYIKIFENFKKEINCLEVELKVYEEKNLKNFITINK